LDEESKEIRRLEEIDHEYNEVSPDGLPSDIAPWLGVLYRKREKKIEAMFRESWEIIEKLFSKADATYVPAATITSAGELQWLFLQITKAPKIKERILKEIEDNI
ncbi:hypothetical protein V5799_008999, partial [Amblyomma americanum]